jgi:RHS repeat-associated protein
VTQSGIGHVLFKAADIYTATLDDQGNVIEGLAGAKIHIQNEKVLTVEKTLTTDNTGEALFSDLPTGRYKFKATASNHQEVIGRFRIKPGVTLSERLFLDYNLVTVEWSVTEITIEDRYEITLEATYETNVPAPVVLLEPLSVNLPDMQQGEVYYGEFTLTNYGLIRADDLKFDLPSDQYFKYDLLGDLPISLGAKERITIPYRITALKRIDQSTDGSGGGCKNYYQRFLVTYTYQCADGTKRQDSKTVTFLRSEGECTGTGIGGNGWGWWGFGGGGGFGGGSGGGGGGSGGGCVGAGCGSNQTYVPPKISPNPKPIDGDKCKPIAERWDEIDDCGNIKATTRQGSSEKVGSSVSLIQMEFNDDANDLSIKVPGGMVTVERQFYANTWYWQYTRNKLYFNWNTLGNYISSIEKDGVIYPLFIDSAGTVFDVPENPIYIKDNAKILKLAAGYRWQSLTGKWKVYDSNGRMTAFGTRMGTVGKLLYQDNDPNSSAIGIADRNDRQVIWFEYNPNGLLSAARDLDNRLVEYSYTNEHLTGVKDVLGQETVYEYSNQGYLIKKVDAGGRITRIKYNSSNHPSAVLDGNGEGSFFAYDYDASKKEYYGSITTSAGKIKEIWYNKDGETKHVDINGRTVKTLDKDRRDVLITDEKGNVTRKHYDEWGNITHVVYPNNATASFEYEHRFNHLIRSVDRRGNVTKYQYDEQGNLVQTIEAVGTADERVTKFTYDTQNQLLSIIEPGDAKTEIATTQFTYDSNGNIASFTDSLNNTIAFLAYDNLGNPSRIEDVRGFIWKYDYDALGRLVSIIDPLNQTTVAYEYDGANNQTAVVDVAKNRFEFVYNKHNQVTKAIDPFRNESRITYNSDKLPIEVIDESNKKGLIEYDNEGRLIRSLDGAGNPIVLHYDETQASFASSYLPAKIEYPTYTQHLYYDKLQRLIRTTDVLDSNSRYSVNYTYDAANNVVSEIDQQGNTTAFEYDALNRLVKITDAANNVTELSYDNRNNVIAVKDANNSITRYEYDKNDNLLKLIRPMGEITQYEYDAADNHTVLLDAKGQKIVYQYDALNRLTQANYYAANAHNTPVKTVTFTYDVTDNLLSYDDGTTSATYTYDALQRKLSESVNYGSFSLSYAYEYEANGLKKSFTGPDEVKIVYEYDSNNRFSAIEIPNVGRVTYNTYQWNSPTKITLPGGSQVDFSYDPLMRLKSKTSKYPEKQVITNDEYEHSPTDNITKKTTEHGEYTYQYDDVYRLTDATHPVLEDESYTYDSLGNRLTAAGVPDGASYNTNNAMIRYGESAFEHDANGNLIKQTLGTQVTHYVYDIEDRLVRVEDGNGNVIAKYYYDPFGRRLWKEVSGVKTYFGYADEGLVGEFDENGLETKVYGYRPDSLWTTNPLFQKTGGGYYWYQNDHIGTPQKLVDNSGNVVWAAYSEAFGDAQVDVALIENNLRFAGQYYDVETGLHYNWHRYYDPVGGRYLSTDPINDVGKNLYEYVFNNPVNWTDSQGTGVDTVADVGFIAYDGYRIFKDNIFGDCGNLGENLLALGGDVVGAVIPFLTGVGAAIRGTNKIPCLNSFTAETLVHTENGLKPIAEIEIGDKVLSFDEESGTTSYQLVVAVIENEQQYQLVKITLYSGKSIEATAEHPFYIKGKGWNPASSLKVGQALVLHNGTTVVVEEVDTSIRTEKVYNLTVANTHNYFVGGDGVLVHNAKCKGTGSYTNTHLSGKKYHGKGNEKRMNQSARRNAREYNDPVVKQEYQPAKNSREAFKDEARRIKRDGGIDNPNNYNKRNSPGKKYLKQDGE